MKTSCGALLYSYHNGEIGIILGNENPNDGFLPFKGRPEHGETREEAAIREIYEETCGLVKLQHITLSHQFSSKNKHYYIGICRVSYDIIDRFNKIRRDEIRENFKEKKMLKFFPLKSILLSKEVHPIAKASVRYYWNRLMSRKQHDHSAAHKYAVSVDFARRQYEQIFTRDHDYGAAVKTN